MKGSLAKIVVNEHNGALCLELTINDKISWRETKLNYVETGRDELIFYWIMNTVKPLFFEMPLDEIATECSQDSYEHFGSILETCSSIIKTTNDTISTYSHLRNVAKDYENILFFNVDENARYKGLYERFCRENKKNILYLNMSSGFNPNTRTWENEDVPMPLSDLINFIAKEEIKKTVSINLYFLLSYLNNTHVYLIPLFLYLGVEFIIFDQDAYEWVPSGYLTKSFYNCNYFDSFTFFPAFHEYWDNKYQLTNVHYVAFPQNYGNEKETRTINKDYAILILTNSRLGNVKPWINRIIYLLDQIPPGSVFTEVQQWYMALRHMILKIMKFDEFEQIHFNSSLHQFFYIVMQFLKYEIIDSIDTTRKIEIYGDVGWQKVFPEYYEKRLNGKEIDDLFLKNSHLYLLLNYGFSYLETSGPVYDAIKKNVPFINIPPMVKTSSFEGFKHIEYRNKEELNYLIRNIRTVFDYEELNESIRTYRKVLNDSVRELEEKLVFDRNIVTQGSAFDAERKEHQLLIDQVTEEYINQNAELLKETFRVLSLNEPIQYDVSKSRYFNKKYVQRILKLIRDEQDSAAFA
ncbi:MAG: hypothetical protein D4R45_03330 [Planctomycetaceae bacterium]|nr:MAG: hypothetical protein D4R45_03330 [Planctomycetaceae bacterium]